MEERYINPHTDFGFKRLFGSEFNKERPAALQERIFTRLFEQAEIATFSDTDLKAYEDSMSAYRDIVNAINTAKKDSFAEGKAEGKLETARMMLSDGEPIDKILRYTGLSEENIEKLR